MKRVSQGTCIGVPIYPRWDDIPNTIATKTTLQKQGKKVAADKQPVGAKKKHNRRGKFTGHYYPLYLIEDAEDKPAPTPKQLAALEKARYMGEKLTVQCSRCKQEQWGRYNVLTVTRKQWIDKDYDNYICRHCKSKQSAAEWAQGMLEQGDFVILDTETTDFDGEIIEIAVIDAGGKTLLNQRIKPIGEIAEGAQATHGISLDDLQTEPLFVDVYEQIKNIIEDKTVVIYNAEFDVGRLKSDCKLHGLEPIKFNDVCAMTWYAQWYGEWSSYWESYKWQSLNGGHSALSDCIATLQVIKKMAKAAKK